MSERPETCQKVVLNNCNGCPVEKIAIDQLSSNPSLPIRETLHMVSEGYCPNGLSPRIELRGTMVLQPNG